MLGLNIMKRNYYIWVLGCRMNEADAERINQILLSSHWQKVDSEKEAELIIVVSCSVKQASMNHVYGKAYEWRRLRQAGKLRTILTGCVLAEDKEKLAGLFDRIMPIGEIGSLLQTVAEKTSNTCHLSLPARRSTNYSALVPISNGCDNYCSYCAVPYVRGREISRSAVEVINECEALIKGGYKEIILLGQNVNSYREGVWDFPRLLKAVDEIPGDYWIRFMSSHPKDLSDELIAVMASGRHIAPHLHLALQSGCDEILQKMNRRYTADHYYDLIKKISRAVTNIMISTDIIVGYPGETLEQFNQTAELMEKIGFDMAYISQYSPRPGTAAATLPDDVTQEEKKRRWIILNEILKKSALANNQKHLGQSEKVLVDGWRNDKCFGKTAGSKIVSFSGPKELLGQFVCVEINHAGSWSLKGTISNN